MTESLRLSFAVASSSEHAFTTWTTRIGSWWPTDHTVSRSEADAWRDRNRIGWSTLMPHFLSAAQPQERP